MPARKLKSDEKPQSERFIEAARRIGADETPEAFERVFASVAILKQMEGQPLKTSSTKPTKTRVSRK